MKRGIDLDNSNFKDTAEKYKNEMMKLYSAKSEPVISEEIQKTAEINELSEELQETAPEITLENLEEKYPPPVLPAFMQSEGTTRPQPEQIISYNDGQTNRISTIRDNEFPNYNIPSAPEHDSENISDAESENPEYTEYGFLKVAVSTARGDIPVPNAAVTISRQSADGEKIIKLTNTDINGYTETFRLPSPPAGNGDSPEDFERFAIYNAEVFAKGFYREISRNIPIFKDITSVQNFNLIPEPYAYDSGGNYIAYYNQEPEI